MIVHLFPNYKLCLKFAISQTATTQCKISTTREMFLPGSCAYQKQSNTRCKRHEIPYAFLSRLSVLSLSSCSCTEYSMGLPWNLTQKKLTNIWKYFSETNKGGRNSSQWQKVRSNGQSKSPVQDAAWNGSVWMRKAWWLTMTLLINYYLYSYELYMLDIDSLLQAMH